MVVGKYFWIVEVGVVGYEVILLFVIVVVGGVWVCLCVEWM